MSSNTPPLLAVRGLTTEFRTSAGPLRAVNDVSFDIHPGQIVGVVGESGSGKTVMARSVLGMVNPPGRIVAGEVLLDGFDLRRADARRLRRMRGTRMAMVFQDPQSVLNPSMTVGAQVAEALRVHGASRQQAQRRTLELLDLVGIPDVGHRARYYPHQFSGGMRQRIVIACAVANNPGLLIADEPTTALDVTIQAQILRLLQRLRHELGVAVLMITHDLGVVAELCDDAMVMYGGRIVERASVVELFDRPRHPYTADLLGAMPRIDVSAPGGRLPAIAGSPVDPARLPPGCAFHPRCRLAIDTCHTNVPDLVPVAGPEHVVACPVTQNGVLPSPPPADPISPRPVAGSATPVLSVTDLFVDVNGRRRLVRHDDPVFAVAGVTLSVNRGETLGLVGESGCGKSTLARAIVGLNTAASGTISVDGTDVTAMDRPAQHIVHASVQYVFQDPFSSLNPRRTVRQTLLEALRVRGRDTREPAGVHDLIRRVGLNDRHLDQYPHMFSGGQRQRIGIARALAAAPQLIICDEPVSALDVSIQAQLINLLESLRDELRLSYLFIAHDLAVVRHISDQLAVMYLGRIVEYGPAEKVYKNPQHPYTSALLMSSPAPTPHVKSRERIVLRGELPNPSKPPQGCRFQARCPIGPQVYPERTICLTVDPALSIVGSSGISAACHFPGSLDMARRNSESHGGAAPLSRPV